MAEATLVGGQVLASLGSEVTGVQIPFSVDTGATGFFYDWGSEGLGSHGYAYADSGEDTGPTPMPYRAKIEGTTGESWDPFWETLLDRSRPVAVFIVTPRSRPAPALEKGFVFRDRIYLGSRGNDSALAGQVAVETPISLGPLLAETRERAGLPVGDLARMFGVSRRQFYNWLSGEHAPDREGEERVRRTAALLAGADVRSAAPRLVRAALLATGAEGSAFDALAAGDLDRGARLLRSALGRGGDELQAAAGQPLERAAAGRAMLEFEHLRDGSRRGDG